MKRERIEDLGIIYEKIRAWQEWEDIISRCESKHSVDWFVTYFDDAESREDLHNKLRALNEMLDEICTIAHGEIE